MKTVDSLRSMAYELLAMADDMEGVDHVAEDYKPVKVSMSDLTVTVAGPDWNVVKPVPLYPRMHDHDIR